MVVAFGNKFAKVDTTPLNRQATCASALPTANSLWLGLHRGPRNKEEYEENIYNSSMSQHGPDGLC